MSISYDPFALHQYRIIYRLEGSPPTSYRVQFDVPTHNILFGIHYITHYNSSNCLIKDRKSSVSSSLNT